ncbi:MAG: putative cell cycle control protein [Streblomastix strix]|uniref:Putative cell cycle control protein n=1 Tax=Streblomastix strix TaxID=222440 RepID=A0A5J4WQB7_9EUKA|nr:MAG: putative cell cycle control protein [Streblomastix strix]
MNKPSNGRFQQQRMPGWFPIMTPLKVISYYFIIGIAFLIVGIITYLLTNKVYHKMIQYNETDSQLKITINQDLTAPIYVHYRLQSYFQNHANFIKFSEDQIKNTTFNDTFKLFDSQGVEIPLDEENITSSADEKRKDFINYTKKEKVWARIATLPTFNKLYAIIHQDLKQGEYSIHIVNQFKLPAQSNKYVNIEKTNGLGGHNIFIPLFYIITGGILIILAIAFTILQKFWGRKMGQYHPYFGSDLADTSLMSEFGSQNKSQTGNKINPTENEQQQQQIGNQQTLSQETTANVIVNTTIFDNIEKQNRSSTTFDDIVIIPTHLLTTEDCAHYFADQIGIRSLKLQSNSNTADSSLITPKSSSNSEQKQKKKRDDDIEIVGTDNIGQNQGTQQNGNMTREGSWT